MYGGSLRFRFATAGAQPLGCAGSAGGVCYLPSLVGESIDLVAKEGYLLLGEASVREGSQVI